MAPASHNSNSGDANRFVCAPPPSSSAVLITPKAAVATDPNMSLERPSLKRKDIEPSGSNRFKIVTQLIIAMKRFQGEGLRYSITRSYDLSISPGETAILAPPYLPSALPDQAACIYHSDSHDRGA